MRSTVLLTMCLLLGCGVSSARLSGSEDEELASNEHLLRARLEESFGLNARIDRMFAGGLLGVATEEAIAESDVQQPLALAHWEPQSATFTVVSTETRFREAAPFGNEMLTVDDDGVVALQGQTLLDRAKGELVALPDASGVLVTRETGKEDSETDDATSIVAVDRAGAVTVIANGEGVDDRPAVSPDGTTVVFVSGRTGIASLFRTTLKGSEPVQLTNVGLENYVRGEDDESEPPGFVPVPVMHDRVNWLDANHLRFDAGGGEYWVVDVRDGSAKKEVTP